jgi:hypothetical protein
MAKAQKVAGIQLRLSARVDINIRSESNVPFPNLIGFSFTSLGARLTRLCTTLTTSAD